MDTAFTDDFRSAKLHLRWIAPGEDPASFTSPDAEGLLLSGGGNGDAAPLLATRIRDEAWTGCASVRPRDGATARFELRIDASHWYGVETDGHTVHAVARIGPLRQELGSAACGHGDGGASAAGPVQLVIVSSAALKAGLPGKNYGPDEVSLGFQQEGQLTVLERFDYRAGEPA
ncbi:MAG TPA: hypothetical protein VIQ52_09710 [Arthrobacter sp.]